VARVGRLTGLVEAERPLEGLTAWQRRILVEKYWHRQRQIRDAHDIAIGIEPQSNGSVAKRLGLSSGAIVEASLKIIRARILGNIQCLRMQALTPLRVAARNR